MGQSSIVLGPDRLVYNFDEHFPTNLKKVALSMSGGVESTLLLIMLIDVYGIDNVSVFSGQYKGRRWWEAENAKSLARSLGVTKFHAVLQENEFMDGAANRKMQRDAYNQHGFDGWFVGINRNLFSPIPVESQETVERLKTENRYVPFVWLEKQHIIDMFYQFGKDDILYQTHSCTTQQKPHCGKCYCCHERVRGFAVLGKKDKATYDRKWEDIVEECYHSNEFIVNPSKDNKNDRTKQRTSNLL